MLLCRMDVIKADLCSPKVIAMLLAGMSNSILFDVRNNIYRISQSRSFYYSLPFGIIKIHMNKTNCFLKTYNNIRPELSQPAQPKRIP